MDLQQLTTLALNIKQWGQELGFAQIGISDIDLTEAEQHLNNWLARDFHGDMDYMQRHGDKRSRPALLQKQRSCSKNATLCDSRRPKLRRR